jgi:VanZ family protein
LVNDRGPFWGSFFISVFAITLFKFGEIQVLKKSLFAVLPAVVWLLLVTILYCTPGSKFPKINWQDKIFLDKWIHLFLFLVLVLLWCRAYFSRGMQPDLKRIFITITILAVVYGILMELVQHFFIPLRSFDYGDIMANALGSTAAYLISFRRFIKK